MEALSPFAKVKIPSVQLYCEASVAILSSLFLDLVTGCCLLRGMLQCFFKSGALWDHIDTLFKNVSTKCLVFGFSFVFLHFMQYSFKAILL